MTVPSFELKLFLHVFLKGFPNGILTTGGNEIFSCYFRSSFSNIKDSDVQRVVRRINNRPRKSLNYLTPEQVFKGVRLVC
jgi:hypothetical protein